MKKVCGALAALSFFYMVGCEGGLMTERMALTHGIVGMVIGFAGLVLFGTLSGAIDWGF